MIAFGVGVRLLTQLWPDGDAGLALGREFFAGALGAIGAFHGHEAAIAMAQHVPPELLPDAEGP